MSLTPKTKKEVLNVYNTWLHSYLNGDVATYDSFLDDTFHFIGSTANEEFLNRKDTTKFFEATADQLSGKSQPRNETKIVEQFGELVFITHLFDAWFLSGEDWKFYGRFRFSNALKNTEEGWKFIYQHYSTPDTKAQEGETIGFDLITAENLQLREAIQRRTKELESKNQELEIESALERVRAIAMSMRTSEELIDVCSVVFSELQKLGFTELRNTMIHIFKDEEQYFINYDYSIATGGNTIKIPYQGNPGMEKFIKAIRKSEDAFHHLAIKGKELKDWKKFRNENKEYEDPSLAATKSLHYYNFSLGASGIGISTYSAISKEKQTLLQRFRNVFKLAYQRFTDITIAEAQTREAQIDLALERIRSQATAMKESSDLLDIVVAMRNEFTRLGHEAHYFWHMMWLKNTYEKAMTSGDGTKIGFVMELPRHIHGNIPLLASWEKSKNPTVIYAMNVEEALAYIDKMISLGDFKNIDPQAPTEADIRQIGGLTFIMARTTHGEIGYSLPGVVENPPNAAIEILVKFAGAFDLAHQRFLDLQKAEKQAKETRIELALERIRSRVTAMKKSSDLFEIVVAMRNEFISLGQQAHYFWHMKWLEKSYEMSMTAEDGGRLGMVITVPKFVHDNIPALAKWEKSKEPTFVLALDAEDAWDYIENMNTHGHYQLTDPKAPTKEAIEHIGGLTFIIARTTHGEIGYSLAGVVEHPPKVALDILKRFAGAFDLAYRRFLDLQKAEAQARETQIELALEKVRSRTMAMHKSEELEEVIQVVYEQFASLEISIEHTGFILDYKENDDMVIWLADQNAVFPQITLPYFDCSHWNSFKDAKKKGKNFFINQLDFEEKNKFYKDLFQFIPELPKKVKEHYFICPGLAISTVLMDNVGLYIENFDGIPFSEEENAILMRFGKVFQQTYTRFLDLQKAEAQARESNIEAALEKVRSRSLAMQKSDELREVGTLLYNELSKLGIEKLTSGYVLMDEEEKIGWSYGINPKTGKIQEKPHGLRQTETKVMKDITTSWKKQERQLVIKLDQKETVKHQSFVAERTINFPMTKEELLSISPERLVVHTFNFNQGYLIIVGSDALTEKQQATVTRFTVAFQQTYTRFLDLQKAEAQTREAQIEMALEKVRSRSLAMHTTNELQEVVAVVAEKLKDLGVIFDAGGVILCTYFQDTKDVLHWIAADDFSYSGSYLVPYFENPIFDEAWNSKIQGDTYFSKEFSIEDKNSFFEYAFEHSDYKHFPDEFKQHVLQAEHHRLTAAWSKNSAILIPSFTEVVPSKNDAEIVKRFAKVFEQAYIRFMDLQKAEKRARESQIDIALERVRARAMAMHQSDELSAAAEVLYQEFHKLGVTPFSCGYLINDNENNCWEVWMTDANDASFKNFWTLPFNADQHLERRYKSWKNKKAIHVTPLEGAENSEHHKIVAQFAPWKAASMEGLPNRLVLTSAHFTHGHLLIVTAEELTPEVASILTRFAKVFEQAYIRFMDLLKAEKQAKEAKIEASLEKVRNVALTLKKSDDMLDIAKILYEQLLELGFTDIRNAIIDIHNDATETFIDYDYSHDMSSAVTEFSFYGDPVIEQQIKKTQSANDAFFEIELKGEQLDELIETRLRNGEKDDPRLHKTNYLTYNLYSFGNGAIGISNFGVLTNDQKKILKRFRNVFTFAYKRYTDLAKAEAQAMEAKIEASLEKVRNVALGMKQSDHLLEIAQALYEQLLELGFSDIRNALIDVNNEDDETFMDYDYSHEMGGTVTKMSYNDDPTLKEQLRVIAATTDGYSEMVLEGQQLQDLIEMRRNNGEADDPRLSKTDSISYILYAFGNGAIGISNFGALNDNQKAILDRFRNVFIFAYQRYNDLAHTEEQAAALLAEKQRLEVTLSDLQATQKQLIQSEKMASLGELTAGIAHEIQNPLNFVNNFSEVNNELIEELDTELQNGDIEEVKLLLIDIKNNLDKINHHGKRADAIVKGMLQHSRKSNAQKEPTNINKLAEEYLRLAYHGLRAKDKSFNATLKTDFDERIGLVNVIPQDIGRVILNLITNAFYATNERKKASGNSDFKPTVSIATKSVDYSPIGLGGERTGNAIEISVKDNGNGIPKDIIDKIFQPFYTTKPTGEGTGLGLSMSYDIVTTHGGTLSVTSKAGIGSKFIIKLPK